VCKEGVVKTFTSKTEEEKRRIEKNKMETDLKEVKNDIKVMPA